MNLRAAVAAWVALALLAGALPALAVVVPKFGGAKNSAASPDGTLLPHGAAGAAGRGGRVPHPELLRAAALGATDDTASGRTQTDTDAAVREQGAQPQPWAAAPHMRVRLTGDLALDAALLKSLNAELSAPVDPDRLRTGSLADDAFADDTLAGLVPRRPDAKQQKLWRFLRGYPPQLDLYHLTQAMRPLQGDTLLVMAHVDGADGALVFKARNGRHVRLPASEFEQAARKAGVQLLIVGCKSARQTSAGFVDDLNALDAARAMARAAHTRPSTMFDLFNALSGPERVIEINGSTFSVVHKIELTAGPGGAVLSTLHWSGPQAQAASRAASTAEGESRAPLALPQAGWWSQAALPWLGAAVLLSLLAGATAARGLAKQGDSVTALVGGVFVLDLLGHLLLLPLFLTVLAESVAGASGSWWAWLGGLSLLLLALGCVAAPWSDPELRRARGFLLLQAARAVIFAAPLLAVALLHAGWLGSVPVMQALQALYVLGRPLPGPWLMVGGAVVLVWLSGWVVSGVQAVGRARNGRQARAGQRALWLEQLAAAGVSGTAAHAAVATRAAFERRCAAPVKRVPRWDQAHMLTEGHAPDPWSGMALRHWRLMTVTLLAQVDGVEPQAGFGLLRAGSPFMHPLPPVLLQRWHEQDLHTADVPVLLAQIEARLGWTDFMPPGGLPRLRGVMFFGAAFSAAFASIAVLMDPGSGERTFSAGTSAVLLALLVLWPACTLARRRWQLRWLQRVRPTATPASTQPPAAAAAG